MNDFEGMALAVAQGRLALWRSAPNPPVGCVLVRDGAVIATGHTAEVGGPHAEASALAQLLAQGGHARGATAYVTLEPCSHHGRTPPCADALVREGVRRVVVALPDPNPLVAGRGFERLRAAGIEVDCLPSDHPHARAARETMIGFLSRMVRGRPWARMKIAGSLDGRTALDNGESQWITGPAARADGHAWRARASAVLTGVGTVLDDDPRMDVREVDTPRQPWRVVLDSTWRTPPGPACCSRPARCGSTACRRKRPKPRRGVRRLKTPVPLSSTPCLGRMGDPIPAGSGRTWQRAVSTNCIWKPVPGSTPA